MAMTQTIRVKQIKNNKRQERKCMGVYLIYITQTRRCTYVITDMFLPEMMLVTLGTSLPEG